MQKAFVKKPFLIPNPNNITNESNRKSMENSISNQASNPSNKVSFNNRKYMRTQTQGSQPYHYKTLSNNHQLSHASSFDKFNGIPNQPSVLEQNTLNNGRNLSNYYNFQKSHQYTASKKDNFAPLSHNRSSLQNLRSKRNQGSTNTTNTTNTGDSFFIANIKNKDNLQIHKKEKSQFGNQHGQQCNKNDKHEKTKIDHKITHFGYNNQSILNRQSLTLKQKKNSLKNYGQNQPQNTKSYLQKKSIAGYYFRGTFNSNTRNTQANENQTSEIYQKNYRYTAMQNINENQSFNGKKQFQKFKPYKKYSTQALETKIPPSNAINQCQKQNLPKSSLIKRQNQSLNKRHFYQQTTLFTQPNEPNKYNKKPSFLKTNHVNRQSSETILNNQSFQKQQIKSGIVPASGPQKLLEFSKPPKKYVHRVKTQPFQQSTTKQQFINNQYIVTNAKNPKKIQYEQNLLENKRSKFQFFQKNAQRTKQEQIDWKKDLIIEDKIGQGTFGKVYKAKVKGKNNNKDKQFAVKKVFVDKKYKSRELQMVNLLNHPNIMKVHHVFITQQRNDQYLNIVMDQYPFNLFEVINGKQSKSMKHMQPLQQKLYIYQMLKGLSYIHSLKICHRDIKPHNMLVKEWQLVLCDFGSAKKLIKGENNLSYICSRCYRAPQLIFGSTSYTTQIDLWSVGCIILEMLNKIPLFIGENSLDHLLEVIKVLGTPTKDQVLAMNPEYDLSDYQLPLIKRKTLSKLFPKADNLLLDLLNKLLVYSPKQRLTAIDALNHKYFDEIRNKNTIEQIISKNKVSENLIRSLFQFTQQQLKLSNKTNPQKNLIPSFL